MLHQVKATEGDPLPFTSDQKLVDKVVEWERQAAEQYKEDGFSDGWDSDNSLPETAEQRYTRVSCLPASLLQGLLGLLKAAEIFAAELHYCGSSSNGV